MKNIEKGRAGHSGLRRGDSVIVIAGGNKNKPRRTLKGKTGKVLRFVGADRLVIEGLNIMVRHQRAAGPNKPGGKIEREAPLHISNVMYYVEKIGKPVRLRQRFIEGGKKGRKLRKVRGYLDPQSKEFVQLDT